MVQRLHFWSVHQEDLGSSRPGRISALSEGNVLFLDYVGIFKKNITSSSCFNKINTITKHRIKLIKTLGLSDYLLYAIVVE